MIVTLKRAQIGKASGLDITVKSAPRWSRPFTPTWEMVLGHKNKTISDEEYTQRYHEILEQVPKDTWRELWLLGQESGEVILLCYCPDRERSGGIKFCHTRLLAAYAAERFPKAFKEEV